MKLSIIPNAITTLAACAGIVSISLASEGRFESSLMALVLACVCDGLDGRMARCLKACSKIGAELDSLADFVNFGVAPALIMYFWLTGGPFHRLVDGSAVSPLCVRMVLGCALFYAICGCFRLARFNTMLDKPQEACWKHFFVGVPAPGGCWLVLTPVVITIALSGDTTLVGLRLALQNPIVGMLILVFVGVLMASRLPTLSIKKMKITRRGLLIVISAVTFVIFALVSNFWLTIGVLGIVYLLSIPLCSIAFLHLKVTGCP